MQQKTDAPRRIETEAARHPRRSPRRVTDWSGLILAAPTVLLVAAFTLYPLGVIEEYVPWLTTPELARMAVVIVFIWTQLPLVSVLLLAALPEVSNDLYDAAAVDGASALGRFRYITLPGIRPMLVIVTVYEILMALATFDLTYSLTGGGPGTATTLL